MFHVPVETIVKDHENYSYRQKGKQAVLSCIAEGELVLTNCGLVPIEQITLAHRLWDGESWVSHGGVVCNGAKEVIEYDGLRATRDHLVWVRGQENPVLFGYAAQAGLSLSRSGHGRIYRSRMEPTVMNVYDIRDTGPHNRYTVSGVLVHNCGYGGGVGALKNMGAKMPEEEMQPLVDAWRAANPRIVAFWYALERAAARVIEHRETVRVGRVTIYYRDDRMFIRLPSGRDLCYVQPHFTVNRFRGRGLAYMGIGANHQWTKIETFSGKLAENATQSIARDLLAEAMLRIEKAGYSIVFHVHDEVVLEAPNGRGSVEEVCALMSIPPDWADGLPLSAAGDELAFYMKS